MSDIFQEVDEELRRENFAKLWARYNKYVIALAVLIVVATFGITQWRQYQLRHRQSEGVRYAAALDLARQGKEKDAADAFASIARQASGGHATLARLEEGAIKSRSGDNAGAIAVFDGVAGDGSLDALYRDVATLLWAQESLKSGDPRAIIARLAPLTSAESAWHATALELTALAQLKAGDRAAAHATYQRIADDLAAPQGARARATEMVAALAE